MPGIYEFKEQEQKTTIDSTMGTRVKKDQRLKECFSTTVFLVQENFIYSLSVSIHINHEIREYKLSLRHFEDYEYQVRIY